MHYTFAVKEINQHCPDFLTSMCSGMGEPGDFHCMPRHSLSELCWKPKISPSIITLINPIILFDMLQNTRVNFHPPVQLSISWVLKDYLCINFLHLQIFQQNQSYTLLVFNSSVIVLTVKHRSFHTTILTFLTFSFNFEDVRCPGQLSTSTLSLPLEGCLQC